MGEVNGLNLRFMDNRLLKSIDVSGVAAGLQRHMPNYGVAQYFEKKGHVVLTGADCACVAVDREQTAAALLSGNFFPGFFFINTLLIGERFQRTSLLKRMLAELFRRTFSTSASFTDLLVIKTYNPISYCALRIFNAIPATGFYPIIGGRNVFGRVKERLRAAAAMLDPECVYDPETSVLKDCAYGVTEQFYVCRPICRDGRVNEYFRKHLSPRDRLLCGLSLESDRAKERFLTKLGWHAGARAQDQELNHKEVDYA